MEYEHQKTLCILLRLGAAPLSLISEIWWSFPDKFDTDLYDPADVALWEEEVEGLINELRDQGLVEATTVKMRTPLGKWLPVDGWRLTRRGEDIARKLPAWVVSHLSFPKQPVTA